MHLDEEYDHNSMVILGLRKKCSELDASIEVVDSENNKLKANCIEGGELVKVDFFSSK